ncbi:hypothetical protein [Paenibacillus paeoniae]|uniref:Uncharacterized protein n=1 Tax=Paenibacillus paeoniae TaxID=2292705 RepID=A0A371P7K0_9BACL|nr:hypothetical protein [Paenibacillus paeoniae]REK71490.1 hypothetical protein DX130_21050 [Paenibacillus paeoniae]
MKNENVSLMNSKNDAVKEVLSAESTRIYKKMQKHFEKAIKGDNRYSALLVNPTSATLIINGKVIDFSKAIAAVVTDSSIFLMGKVGEKIISIRKPTGTCNELSLLIRHRPLGDTEFMVSTGEQFYERVVREQQVDKERIRIFLYAEYGHLHPGATFGMYDSLFHPFSEARNFTLGSKEVATLRVSGFGYLSELFPELIQLWSAESIKQLDEGKKENE